MVAVPEAQVVLLGSNGQCLYTLHVSGSDMQSDMRVDYVCQFKMAFPILNVAALMGDGETMGQQVCDYLYMCIVWCRCVPTTKPLLVVVYHTLYMYTLHM